MKAFFTLLLATHVLCHTVAANVQQRAPPTTTRLWSTQITSNSQVVSNTAVTVNGTVVFASGFDPWDGADDVLNAVSCVDAATGALLWSVSTWGPVQFLSLQGSSIVVQSTNWIASLSPQGAQLWNLSASDSAYSLMQSPPLSSTDASTVFTWGQTKESGVIVFSVFAIDLHAAKPALTPVFTSTALAFSSYDTLTAAYVVPVSGADFLFLFSSDYHSYFSLNASNFADPTFNFTKSLSLGCYSASCAAARPVVDLLNGVVYVGFGNYFQAFGFASGTLLGSLTMNFNGTSNWATMALCGVWNGPNGALSGLTVYATSSPASGGSDCSSLFHVATFNGNAALSATNLQVTSPSLSTIAGTDVITPSGVEVLYVVNSRGTFGAINMSSGSWQWITPSIFADNYPYPSLRASTFLNGKVYAVINGYLFDGPQDARDRLVVVDGATGQLTAQYAASSDFATSWIAVVPSMSSEVSSAVLMYSGSGELMNVDGSVIGTGSFLDSGTVSTRVLYANDALYFGTGGVNLTCVGATNGSVLFVTTVAAASPFSPFLAPVLANGKIFVLGSDGTVFVFADSGLGGVTAINTTTWGAGCSGSGYVSAKGPLVVSPDERYVYLAAGGGLCVVQFSTTGTITTTAALNTVNSDGVHQPPLVLGDYVYTADDGGYVTRSLATSFGNPDTTVTSNTSAGSFPGDFAHAGGELYFAAGEQIFRYDEVTLRPLGSVTNVTVASGYGRSNIARFAPMWRFKNNIYTCVFTDPAAFGIAAYDATDAWNGATPAVFTTFPPGSTTALTVPAISSDGIFVFASSDGVFAMTWTGAMLWARTDLNCQDLTNTPIREYQTPVIRLGVVYVLCNNAMHLLDLHRNGTDWQVGSKVDFGDSSYPLGFGVQFFVNPNGDTIVTINQAMLTITTVVAP